jgi:hypothetical protein
MDIFGCRSLIGTKGRKKAPLYQDQMAHNRSQGQAVSGWHLQKKVPLCTPHPQQPGISGNKELFLKSPVMTDHGNYKISGSVPTLLTHRHDMQHPQLFVQNDDTARNREG